ncbi:oxidoreductase [Sphingorhabdus sp. Alg239-R122]|uniref:oxidoreductase n=1 Tax=Sphingorhabdus sp. Alg239-R122 TaxID=2305989 RepID=UPI0013D9D806|nr:oxidoreductase [Sphingorhabdus sp. Alg239-R122]
MAAVDQQPLGSGFGKDTPASEVMQGIDLAGKTSIVTGGYSGIGVETVRALAAAGAEVIVPARNREKAEENLADIEGTVRIADMDLGDIGSVRGFAAHMRENYDKLDILINNAGVMASPLFRVGPGWEGQFGTNHMGHFALTQELMPLLEKAEAPRVVALSSTAHKMSDIHWDDPNFENHDYDKWQSYGQAKTANALFAVALDRRMRDFGGRAFSVHPGGISTPLQRHLPLEEQIAMGWRKENGEPSDMAAKLFKSVEAGGATAAWAATSPLLGDNGGLYCEDCDVAQLGDDESPRFTHVQPHAVDEESAERLWQMSEEMLKTA